MSRPDGMYRDRDGELIPMPPRPGRKPHLVVLPTVTEAEKCPHDCDAGWIGPAILPAPCPACRPDTVRRMQQRRERCKVCHTRLHASLVEDGIRTHPECDA